MRKEDFLHEGREMILIDLDELSPPYCRVTHSTYPGQNPTRAKRKAITLANLYASGKHTCAHCGDLIPTYKRLDSKYCSEACRKAAARLRRKAR